MMWTNGRAANVCRIAACTGRWAGVWLLGVGIGLAGLTLARGADPSALPLALTPAGQGPITVGPRDVSSAGSRGEARSSSEALAASPGADAAARGAERRWRPPLDVRLVPASSPDLVAGGRQAARPLAPRRSPARSGLPADGSLGAARPTSLVAGSLAAVLGVLALVVWCTRKFAPPGMSALPKEVLEPLGRAVLPGQQAVQLLRLGGKLLLIGQRDGSLATLAEISDPAEVEHLLVLCRRQRPDSATAAFAQVLSQLTQGEGAGGADSPRRMARGGR